MEAWLDKAAKSHEAGVVNYVYAKGYGRLPTPRDCAFYKAHIPHRARFHEQRRAGAAGCSIKQAEAELHRQFSQLETALQDRDYLVANEYSLADIAWFPNTLTLSVLGYSFEQYPNIQAWMKRIQARPAFKDKFRKELPPVPLPLLGLIARTLTRVVRKFGQRF